MARYGSEHKQVTRQRIIDAAGRRLKQDGIDGSGVATLMADAGLTNGAFYAHFDSRTTSSRRSSGTSLIGRRWRSANCLAAVRADGVCRPVPIPGSPRPP